MFGLLLISFVVKFSSLPSSCSRNSMYLAVANQFSMK